MKTALQILFFIISLNIFAQTENIDRGKYHPAKEVFESKYRKQEHTKFSQSQIQIFENKVILFGLKSIEYSEKTERKYKLIFENGLLNPTEINGSTNLKICCLEELTLLNPNPQTKRFKFWIFPAENIKPNANELEKMLSNTVNPNEYYFELQNLNADENTSYEDFIKNSELTFLIFGTIII